MAFRTYFYLTTFLLLLNGFCFQTEAITTIKGVVTDSLTKEPLPFITISLDGSSLATMTDNSGKFLLRVPDNAEVLKASSMNYKQKLVRLTNEKLANIKIQLCRVSFAMSEVVVKPRKEKYRKKGNPAVDFVRKVIATKAVYDPLNKDYYHYGHYERIDMALNGFRKEKNKTLLGKYSFITNYVDTSELSGKPILPLSTREMMEEYYYRKSPQSVKRIIKAKKSSGIDEMLSEDGIEQFLSETFKDVDIYDNDITMFLKKFVSPLSTGGPDFYKYYLQDTTIIGNDKCVDLCFVPLSSESCGFTGHLYITLDSTNFVKKVKLNFPRDINLNFIQNMAIGQEFNRAPDGTRLLTRDDIMVEFSLLAKSDGLYAHRTNIYTNHSFAPPADETIFSLEGNTIQPEDGTTKSESYWKENRPDSAKVKENSVEKLLARLRKDPFFYYTEKVCSALITGYIPTTVKDNKFNLGPMYSTISANTVEGLRLRASGYTTAQLNNHWFASGFLAYGTTDQKAKGLAQIEYSFNKKKNQANEFPVNSIRASYNYDLNHLGQNYLYSTPDNMFLSLTRQPDNKMTYEQKIELSYNREYQSQFSTGLDLRYLTEYDTPYLPFINNTNGANISSYSLGEMQLRLRFAPGEKFYQGPGRRHTFERDAPVFTFSHTQAFKGLMNSDYTYSHTEIGFQQRFWFSAYGNVLAIVKAGKVWTKAPFPLLISPNANLSYTIQYESYPMMNAMEFINDQYASWDLSYDLDGLILNRIPVIKALKWREIFSFCGLYGNLNSKNDPMLNNNLFEFPTTTYRMGKEPYMEAGIGLTNILKFLRVDYIWRLNYLNHPNIDKSGLRISADFNF